MADVSGRWSTEEHDRFLIGMDIYGKKWTKVAEFVRTRSTVQVRSHAQKHFQKVGKGTLDAEASDSGERPFQKRRLNIDILRRAIPVPPPLTSFQSHPTQPLVIDYINHAPLKPAPSITMRPAPPDTPLMAPLQPTSPNIPLQPVQPESPNTLLMAPRPASPHTQLMAPPLSVLTVPQPVKKSSPSVSEAKDCEFDSDDFLPPPPAHNPKIEITFSSMEVDEKLFTALLNDDEFIIAAQKSRDDSIAV